MNFFRWRKKRKPPAVVEEATRARDEALEHLEDAQKQAPEVTRVTNSLKGLRRENHIAEAILATLQPKPRRRIGHGRR